MREWIKLKSIPRIAFAHTYATDDGFKNHIPIRENFLELSYCRYGKCYTIKNGKKFVSVDGSVGAEINKTEIDASYEGPFEAHSVGMVVDYDYNEAIINSNFSFSLIGDRSEKLMRIIDELIFLHHFHPEREHKIVSLIFDAVDILNARFIDEWQQEEEVSGEVSYVNKAKTYIKSRIAQKISINDIAKYLHVSSSYICVVFKKITGETIVEYINKYRLYLIKNYVASQNMTLKEACAHVGIKDPAYASRLFKKTENQSIREFKRTGWINPAKEAKK